MAQGFTSMTRCTAMGVTVLGVTNAHKLVVVILSAPYMEDIDPPDGSPCG